LSTIIPRPCHKRRSSLSPSLLLADFVAKVVGWVGEDCD
jgi:hypothetical protein